MAALNTVQTGPAGVLVPMAAASAGGDTFSGKERGVLILRNADAAAATVTIVVPGTGRYGQPEPDIALVVPAGETAVFGMFDGPMRANGEVSVTYSKVTALTVAYVELP